MTKHINEAISSQGECKLIENEEADLCIKQKF